MTIKHDDNLVRILYFSIIVFIGIILGFTSHYLRNVMSDTSSFFHYNSLVSTKQNYDIGEDIYFISNIERFREIDVQYTDTLKCDNGEDFVWFSQSKGEFIGLKPGLYHKIWRYEGDIPNFSTTCFLESSPSVVIDYGIKKTQFIKTNTFTIGK